MAAMKAVRGAEKPQVDGEDIQYGVSVLIVKDDETSEQAAVRSRTGNPRTTEDSAAVHAVRGFT